MRKLIAVLILMGMIASPAVAQTFVGIDAGDGTYAVKIQGGVVTQVSTLPVFTPWRSKRSSN